MSVPGVDLERLGAWMDAQGLPAGPIENAEQLGGGTQNVLLRFDRGGERYVLRRPPVHKRDNSDETMRREARVLTALRGSDVPHPDVIAACSETDTLGAAFYLMEPIDGFNATVRMPELHAGDETVRNRMGRSMAEAAAALGRVDFQAVGLDDFGKAEGFLERQVPRWRAHLEGYNTFEGYPGPEIPGVDRVADWLEANIPTTYRPGIIHGDYHISNVMFRFDGPELAAAVDWELATIGDPLLDLGWLLATWFEPEHPGEFCIPIGNMNGLPTGAELVEHYREGTDRDLSAMNWYAVLACYKLGIILEGTHARACAGKAPKPVGDALHMSTLGLFARAVRLVEQA